MSVMYSSRSMMQVTLHALELVNTDSGATRGSQAAPFRSFGEVSTSLFIPPRADSTSTQPLSLPKDAHDLTPLVKTVAVCGERGMLIVDPTKYVSPKLIELF